MNKVHATLLRYIRDESDTTETSFLKILTSKTDEQMMFLMFMNYRGGASTKGLRLTNMGYQIMRHFFRAHDIPLSGDPRELSVEELLYLDRKTKLPYYVSPKGQLSVFDEHLAMHLRLADGDLSLLVMMADDLLPVVKS